MRDSSDKWRRRTAPVACAVLMVVFFGVVLVAVLYALLGIGSGDGAANVLLALYALVILAVIVGVLIALRQRLREIEGGEEEDARKY